MTVLKSIKTINILLIEDDHQDALLIRELLSEDRHNSFYVDHADRISHGIESVKQSEYDAILLDLFLSDSQGIDSLKKIVTVAPDVPVVITTGADDEYTAFKALREGAQDYLVKHDLNATVLCKALLFAIERRDILLKMEKVKEHEFNERDKKEAIRAYHHFLALSQVINVNNDDKQSLDGEKLQDYVSEYRDITYKYIHALRIKEERPTDLVRDFAQRLASIRINARDIIRIHLTLLNDFSQRAMPDAERAFSNDARLVLVELMGNILDIYLKYCKDK